MKKIGPWQHCDSCNKNQSYEWIAELVISCSVCHREVRVFPALIKSRRIGAVTESHICIVLNIGSVPELNEILDTTIEQTKSPGLNWANGLR